jgi:hypothetical protein
MPVLRLWASLKPLSAYTLPIEREVDRNLVLELAPDRDEILSTDKTVQELRRLFKVRCETSQG